MGKMIVIDGLDGCGKATQAAIVEQKLKDKGYKVKRVSFPDYDSPSSDAVKMYLNGEISSNPDDINAYTASLFYTVDRAIQFKKEIAQYYKDKNTVILADRYISANIIYQGSKFLTDEMKVGYFKWMYDLETSKVGIPIEDITLALTLPLSTSQALMTKRYNGDESKKDIHEKDLSFLSRCSKTLDLACNVMPQLGYNWVRIDCADQNGNIAPLEVITNKIMEALQGII